MAKRKKQEPSWFTWPTGVSNRSTWPKVSIHINWRDRRGKLRRQATQYAADLAGKNKTAQKAKLKDLVDKAVAMRERHLAAKRGIIAEQLPAGRGAPFLRDFFIDWAKGYRPGVKSTVSAAKRIVEELGHLRANNIKQDDLHAAVISWVDGYGLAANTVLYHLGLIGAWFKDQGLPRYGVANPGLSARVRKKYITDRLPDERDTPYLRDRADIAECYHKIPSQRDRCIFAVGAFAGLRPSETLALRPDDVDMSKRLIRVARQKVRGKQETGPTKSRRIRWAPIDDDLFPILKDWLTLRSRKAPPKGYAGKWPARYLFTTRTGRMVDYEWLVELRQKYFPVTIYQATRHTFASHWIARGRRRGALQAAMGHRSYETTKRYAHLDPKHFGDDLSGHLGELLNPPAEEKVVRLPVNKAITNCSQTTKGKRKKARKAK